jgi:hypothetical protein
MLILIGGALQWNKRDGFFTMQTQNFDIYKLFICLFVVKFSNFKLT